MVKLEGIKFTRTHKGKASDKRGKGSCACQGDTVNLCSSPLN